MSVSVPVEALSNNKCTACNKYLSYFPIYLDKAQNNSPICGRCAELLPDAGSYSQNTTYESLAQYLKFPCIFQPEGCTENLIPADVPNHEKDCAYRIISCSLECVWQGTVNELLDHFEEMHPNAILRNGEFEIDILNSYDVFSLVVYSDELFSFRRKFDSEEKKLECSLFCYKMLDSITTYNYEITVQNGARNLSVKFPLKSADTFQRNNVTQICIDDIRKKLDDPSIIIGNVRIFEFEDLTPLSPRQENPEINLEMLTELECPVCMEHIIPPIYQCITGHSICAECKVKVPECPTCKQEIKNTQNFTLEKMAFLLTYPCKFTDYGCDFASKPGKIKQHQKHCQFGPQECPLADYEKCQWKSSAKELYSHVFNVHHDNILEIDHLTVFISDNYFQNEDNECYIKKFSNLLFKLHYRYARDRFYWAMQLIGQPEEAKNYKFEIDIFDNNHNNQRIVVRRLCSEVKNENETFVDEAEYVFLLVGQIRSLLTDQLTYSVRIVK